MKRLLFLSFLLVSSLSLSPKTPEEIFARRAHNAADAHEQLGFLVETGSPSLEDQFYRYFSALSRHEHYSVSCCAQADRKDLAKRKALILSSKQLLRLYAPDRQFDDKQLCSVCKELKRHKPNISLIRWLNDGTIEYKLFFLVDKEEVGKWINESES